MALLEPSIPGSYTLAMATDAEFERAGSNDEALDVLLGRFEALGFDGVDSAYLPRTHAPDGGWVGPYISGRNFPTGWQKGWARYSRHDNDLTIAKPGHYERLDKVSGLLPRHGTWADDHVS